MNCANCGAPVPAGVGNCPYCGVTLHGNATGRQIEEDTVFDGGGTIFVSREGRADEQGGWSGQVPRYDSSVPQGSGGNEETEFVTFDAPIQPVSTPDVSPTRPSRRKQDHSRRNSKKTSPSRKNNPLRVMLIVLFIMVLLLLVAKEILLPKLKEELRDMYPTYSTNDVSLTHNMVSFFEESKLGQTEATYDLPN